LPLAGQQAVTGDPAASAARAEARGTRRLILASTVGTVVEWYDFFLYGLIAPLIFDQLFFPKLDPVAGTFAVYATFAVGFASRPLGGIFFGHFGDKIGRKSMMLVTLLLMGVATVLMGLLPTYEQIGLGAASLLAVLRFLQGFALGGESTAAGLLMIESAAAQKRRGLMGAIVQAAGPVGVLLASLSALLITQLPREQLFDWGWRLPFLVSAVLVLIGLYVRANLDETMAFTAVRQERRNAGSPALEALARHKKAIFVVLLAAITESTFYYLTGIYSISFVTKILGLDRQIVTTAIVLANLFALITVPLYGALSDRIGRKRVFMAGMIGAAAYLYLFFGLLETRSSATIILAIVLAVGLIHPFMFAMQSSFYLELFPTGVRFSGVSIGKQLGIVLGGGLAPMIATALLARNNGNASVIPVYYSLVCVITFLVLLVTRETKSVDLTNVDGLDRTPSAANGTEMFHSAKAGSSSALQSLSSSHD
jgi:MFS transporter, MHS family, shikimate and dehydroshikimate transport protein